MLHTLHADILDKIFSLILPSRHCIAQPNTTYNICTKYKLYVKHTKTKTKGPNRTFFFFEFLFSIFPIFVQISVFFFVCFFLSTEKFTCHSFIRFQSRFFFFPAQGKQKKNCFFIHSSEFLKKRTKTNLSAERKKYGTFVPSVGEIKKRTFRSKIFYVTYLL